MKLNIVKSSRIRKDLAPDDSTSSEKGKPGEIPGRKAKGLKPFEGHDRQAAEERTLCLSYCFSCKKGMPFRASLFFIVYDKEHVEKRGDQK